MRNLLIASLLALVGCVSTHHSMPSRYEAAHRVQCIDGIVRSSRIVRTAFHEDFRKGNDQWVHPFINLEGRLQFTHGIRGESRGLVISRRKDIEETDTAFEIVTLPFEVTSGAAFRLAISAKGSADFNLQKGKDGFYVNVIEWLAEDGKLIDTTTFDLKVGVEKSVTEVVGTIPKKAKMAMVHIGADAPDIPADGFLLLSDVLFEQEDTKENYWPTGYVISEQFKLDGKKRGINWKAKVPGGCAVSLQISTAPDDNGRPGAWTPFYGPENNPNRAYLKSGKLPTQPEGHVWARYKLSLQSNKRKTPRVYGVSVGQ